MICCDYCTNAFCKKCVMRNFGRKELTGILDGNSKWHCYVCRPAPLVRLVLACDSTLQKLENAGLTRARLEPPPGAKIVDRRNRREYRQASQASQPSVLSAGLLQRTQRLIEMTLALNQSFVYFLQGNDEDSSDEDEEEEEDRTAKLKDYSNVPVDLQNAYDALQSAVTTELRRFGHESPKTLYSSTCEEQNVESKASEGQPSAVEEEVEIVDIQPSDEESRCSLWVQETPVQESLDKSVEASVMLQVENISAPDQETTRNEKTGAPHHQSCSPTYSSCSASSVPPMPVPIKAPGRPRGRPRKHPKLPTPAEISCNSSSSENGGSSSENGGDGYYKCQYRAAKGVATLKSRSIRFSSGKFFLTFQI